MFYCIKTKIDFFFIWKLCFVFAQKIGDYFSWVSDEIFPIKNVQDLKQGWDFKRLINLLLFLARAFQMNKGIDVR